MLDFWIESHASLANHPKTRRLSRLLNISRVTAVGHLLFLWWWAGEYAQDGSLVRYDVADIADAAGWEGEPETFVSGLLSAGFIDELEDGMHIHDWSEYAGKIFEKRRKDAERKRNCGQITTDFHRISGGNPDESAYNQTKPKQNKPLGVTSICTEQTGDAGSSMPQAAPEKKVPVITLTLNDKTEYPIFEEQCHEWAGLYPAVDVIQQLRAMKGWLNANPKQRKTKAGILKFVNGWLAKEQDRGGNTKGAPRSPGKLRDTQTPPSYDVEKFMEWNEREMFGAEPEKGEG